MSFLNALLVVVEPAQHLVDFYLLEGPVHHSTWMLSQLGGPRLHQLAAHRCLRLAPGLPPESLHVDLVSNSTSFRSLQVGR